MRVGEVVGEGVRVGVGVQEGVLVELNDVEGEGKPLLAWPKLEAESRMVTSTPRRVPIM